MREKRRKRQKPEQPERKLGIAEAEETKAREQEEETEDRNQMPSKRGSVRVCWIYEALKQGTTPRSNIPSSSYASTRGQNRLLSFRRKDASFSSEAFRERLICGALLHSSCSMRVQGVGFNRMAARQTR